MAHHWNHSGGLGHWPTAIALACSMNSMDPWKNDAESFSNNIPLDPSQASKTASKLSFHALCCVGTVRWRLILGCLGWKKGPNMSSYTFNGIWIHERMMLRSFSNKIFLDQSHASKPVLNLSCIVLCGHSQIKALMGNWRLILLMRFSKFRGLSTQMVTNNCFGYIGFGGYYK